MSDTTLPAVPPTASVRFVPAGRRRSFLLPHLSLDGPLTAGDTVVVTEGEHESIGTVVAEAAAVADRRAAALPADGSSHVVRRSTTADAIKRLQQQHKEQEAFAFCQLRIRERALDMKLTRVEHAFDGSRLLFHYTAEHRDRLPGTRPRSRCLLPHAHRDAADRRSRRGTTARRIRVRAVVRSAAPRG